MRDKRNVFWRSAVIAVLLPLLLGFGGCSVRMRSVSELMRPPLPFGDNESLQKAFYDEIGRDTQLKIPVSGKHHSAYVLYDLDTDGENEALVFYAVNGDLNAVRLSVFRKAGEDWLLREDLAGSGSEVYSVSFVDMNGDGVMEILISWTTAESKTSRVLTVYEYSGAPETDGKVLRVIASENVSAAEPMDIDSDGRAELFVLHQQVTAQRPQSFARVLKMDDETRTLYLMGETPLDADVSAYAGIKQEAVRGQPLRVFVDAYRGENQMITEIIEWNAKKERLVTPLLDPVLLKNTLSLRREPIPSMDIDADGTIEIPVQSVWPGSKMVRQGSGEAVNYAMTRWMTVDRAGKESSAVWCAMMRSERYYVALTDQELRAAIAVFGDENERTMRFCEYDNTSGAYGDELLLLITAPKAQAQSEAYRDYKRLFEGETSMTLAYITQSGVQAGLNESFLRNNIKQYTEVSANG